MCPSRDRTRIRAGGVGLWEFVAGWYIEAVKVECPEPDGSGNVPDCSVTHSDAHATEYYVATYRHALSERQQWYRFFERAAFGPSPDMFDNDLGYVDDQGLPKPHESFGDWIGEQSALTATPQVLPQAVQPALGFVGSAFSGVAGSGIHI